jgi:UDP-N-acetylglucosamine 2-epimerase
LRENISDDRIFVTGNTVIDALIWVRDRVLAKMNCALNWLSAILS